MTRMIFRRVRQNKIIYEGVTMDNIELLALEVVVYAALMAASIGFMMLGLPQVAMIFWGAAICWLAGWMSYWIVRLFGAFWNR